MSVIAASDIYDVIDIVGKGWAKFARTKLGLTEVDIEECEYRNELKEGRFQMVQTWMRKEGRHATTARLFEMTENQRPMPERQQSQSQDCYEKFSERPTSNNMQGAGMAPPRDDVSNPNVPSSTNQLGKTKNSSPMGQSRKNRSNRGATGTSTDITPSAKAFGGNTPEKQHKRTESAGSHSVSSGQFSSSESVAKTKDNKSLFKKFKEKVFPTKSKGDSKKKSIDPNDVGQLCDAVHWGKVDLVTDKDTEAILQMPNRYRYPTEINRGCVLILNNSFKDDKDQRRDGADKDVENMEKLWSQIGCDIHKDAPQEEKTADEMRQLLQEMTELKVEYSYIVVVIMTHGQTVNGSVVFRGVDNRHVSVNDIKTIFNNQNARLLINIPKFFIFQFCCGTKLDRGVQTDYKNIHKAFKRMNIVEDTPTRNDKVQADGSKVPTSCDMHFAYATHEEHAALRSPTNGSWFISAITNVFKEHSRSEDIQTLLTRVNAAMKSKVGCYEDVNKKTTYNVKAMSRSAGSLTKTLFLLPGYHK